MLSLHILLGRGATIAGLGKRELPLATRKDDNAHFDYIFCDKGREVDSVAESYLQDLLENVREAGGGTLVPIAVEGDGYCLTHAISKYFFGMELFYHVLREKILDELRGNEVWYTSSSGESMLQPPFTKCEFDELVQAAKISFSNTGEWSPHEHCQVLANILKRPLCLFTALKEIPNQESFMYLPLRHSPEDCFKYPLSIAWQSRLPDGSLNHFIPLCRTSDSLAPIIPKDCQPPFYRCSRAAAERYINYNPDGSYSIGLPVQPGQIDPQHIIFTMGCKQKPHKTTQSGLMYALVDKLSEAARTEILALGGCTTTTSSAAVSSSDSGVATASANEQQIDATASASIHASTSTSIKSSAEMMEWEFFKYCSLPVDQNPDDTDKGDETTVSLVAFDIMLKLYASRIGFSALTKTATQLQDTLQNAIDQEAEDAINLSNVAAFQDPGTLTRNSTKLHMDGHIAHSFRKVLVAVSEATALAVGLRGTVEARARLNAFVNSCINLRIAQLLEHVSRQQLLKVGVTAASTRDSTGPSDTDIVCPVETNACGSKSIEGHIVKPAAIVSSTQIGGLSSSAERLSDSSSKGLTRSGSPHQEQQAEDPLLTIAMRCSLISEAHSKAIATSVATAVIERPHLSSHNNSRARTALAVVEPVRKRARTDK